MTSSGIALSFIRLLVRVGASTAVVALSLSSAANAAVTETKLDYEVESSKLVGYLYSDDSNSTPAPAVIIFSDWMGIGEFSKQLGRDLAAEGYRAFVADIYGGAHAAKDSAEAGKLATKFKTDRSLMRGRAAAAFDTLATQPGVDSRKIAAIGFCFGGTVSLELGRFGKPISGIVSVHGGLETPNPEMAKNIRGKVLVLHGADDPYVPEKEVKAFEDEMNAGKVDWELVKYSGAVHAFTNPGAGNDNSKGAAYNAQAAKRSFERMRDFFKEIF